MSSTEEGEALPPPSHRMPLLLYVTALLVLLISASIVAGTNHREITETATRRSESRADLAAELVASTLRSGQYALQALAGFVEPLISQASIAPGSRLESLEQLLDTKVQKLGFADTIYVVDVDGNLLYSSAGGEGGRVPAWEFLSLHLPGKKADDQVTPVYTDADTGQSWVFIVRNLYSSTKTITGTIIVRQSPRVLASSIDGLSLSDGQSIAIIDEAMALIARLPAVGGTDRVTRVDEPAAMGFIESGREKDQLTTHSPFDGEQRFYGFRRVADAPYVVVVGERTGVALYAWRQSLWVLGAGILLVAVLGALLLRQLHRRGQAEQRLVRENQERQRLQHLAQANEDWLKALVRSIPDLIFVVDEEGKFVFVHAADERDLLTTPDEFIGHHYRDVLPPELADRFREVKGEVRGSGQTYHFDYRLNVGHELRSFEARVNVLSDAHHNYSGFLALVRDVTEQKEREAELRIASAAFETHLGIIVTDKQGTILRANKAFSVITGYEEQEVVGKTPAVLSSGLQDRAFYQHMWTKMLEDGAWEGEVWNRRKTGEVYAEWLTISAVRNPSGAVQNFVGTFHDITRRKKAEQEAHRLAFYDSLTGLANRALLEERIAEVCRFNIRRHVNAALLYLDIEQFRSINDARGYETGDLVLKAMASKLASFMRESDTLARIGGDEFAVLLPGQHATPEMAARSAELVAEKIIEEFSPPLSVAGHLVQVQVSIGIAIIDGKDSPADQQLQRAEQATQQAKERARQRDERRIAFFNPDLQRQVVQHVMLEDELRHAVSRDELLIYYQPQVRYPDQLLGYELLLRWRHPEKGLVSPGVFIPIAEQSRLIIPIGQWLLEQACRRLAAWSADPATSELTLAVNVSVIQFQAKGFVDGLAQILRQTGAPPRMLKLEVTESLLMDDPDRVTETMNTLRSLGVRFSLDDFGTGYSSLSYLRRLPLDQVKIDQSFIRDLGGNSASSAIVESIIGLARGLDLEVIAEGVETDEQRDWLFSHGCTDFQGYLFGRPALLSEGPRL
ncbi:EAL domain-containing protein [Marinobacter bryozoorum]|uniref:bifunctional diguanylate cyclase/phosphodiesterase n=1 Tax=Marinobacter bryozoorum TaxID=256324 RepID=UPI00200464FA|nr:EAL domain-containing protein [Marinobacter bryozoorum]MCK7545043.1 EAL domain-containing protein [Marinobacter bryozoorum]